MGVFMMVDQITTVSMLRKTFKDYDEIYIFTTTNINTQCTK